MRRRYDARSAMRRPPAVTMLMLRRCDFRRQR